jgi:ATPase subunit of ABC transporter with duplicated ATPase domains
MPHLFVEFHKVVFHHAGAAEALFRNVTLHIPTGWTGVVGRNGAGKSTLLKLATGLLSPRKGRVTLPSRAAYCPQRTDLPPEGFDDFLDNREKSALILKGKLGIRADWGERWKTLSHGERKRAQIGVAIGAAPDLLAVDEPTNHVDGEARALLAKALGSFSGIGLLVSHDRELLDTLCGQTIFLDPPEVAVRKGGYTMGKQVAEVEQAALRRKRASAKRKYHRLRREAGRRRDSANQADGKRSKKGIAKKDHDAKQKIDGARLTGKDGVGGKLLRQLDGRLDQAREVLEETRVKKENRLGITMPGAVSHRDLLLDLPEGEMSLGGGKHLSHPALFIRPEDRIGITGPNGSGKSTLIQRLVGVLNVPEEHVTYVPQEIEVDRSREILGLARALSPEKRGMVMTIISRLGSRPDRLLESTTPSPGEVRKLMLALGMSRVPHIIIMDEPTNHMDLPSIECLEQALSDCPGALALISHDQRFLKNLTTRRWHISREENNCLLEVVI